jgi:hypothetical protein
VGGKQGERTSEAAPATDAWCVYTACSMHAAHAHIRSNMKIFVGCMLQALTRRQGVDAHTGTTRAPDVTTVDLRMTGRHWRQLLGKGLVKSLFAQVFSCCCLKCFESAQLRSGTNKMPRHGRDESGGEQRLQSVMATSSYHHYSK